jgi:hypothetical protein
MEKKSLFHTMSGALKIKFCMKRPDGVFHAFQPKERQQELPQMQALPFRIILGL